MNYQISEDEFNSLEGVCNQLGLIAGLVANSDANSPLAVITGAQLLAFVETLQGAVSRVIVAIDERAALQPGPGGLRYFDLKYALRIASGDSLHTPEGAEQVVTAKLQHAANIDSEMRGVLHDWLEILERLGQSTPAPAKPRKREKLTQAEA